MICHDEDKFIVKKEDGSEQVFYKMITFKSNLTNKDYIIYTDGKMNIYSSILIDDDISNMKLEKITNEDDIEEIKKALIQTKISIEKD